MRLWRITRFADLEGMGGVLASGRWHTMPRPVLYCADHPATALLEVFVHLGVDPEDIPDDYRLLAIDAPNDLPVTKVDAAELSPDWRTDLDGTRRIGDEWLAAGATAILDAPSALAPQARTFLVNPRHPDARRLRISAEESVSFDPRLWK